MYGKTVFEALSVQNQIDKHIQPVSTGCFLYHHENPKFINGDYIKIYEQPIPGHPYVIGGDTSGEGSDYFVGQVIDNSNGKQVAVLRHQFDEDLYAEQMYCLGLYYNTALIAIETNYSTYPIKELQRMKYPKLFVRKKEDTYTGKMLESYGVRTDKNTRPAMIAELVKVMRGASDRVVDYDTLNEMLTFVRNERGRAEAESGAHDDCVMALGIAYYARGQQTTEIKDVRRKTKYSKAMLEDYRKANPRDKELLRRLWGEPY